MKLAIFDVDGTLLDNLASEDARYAAALGEGLGLTELDTDWRTYVHVTDQGVAVEAHERAFGAVPSAARLSQTVDHFLTLLADAHAREPLVPIAGAAALLVGLPAHGWIPALATGAWGKAARFKLAAAGLPVEGIALATAEDGPARVAIVRAAWARAAAAHRDRAAAPRSVDQVVLVGDAVWDVAAADALGVPFVGRALGTRAEELHAHGATIVLPDFAQLPTVLAAFEQAVIPRGAAP